MGLRRASEPSCQTWRRQAADGHAGADERRDVHPEHRLAARPLRTGAVPQWASVGTQKAGTSTDDGLKTTILVADDALSSVIVLRTKNKDCLAIDLSNAPCRRWLPGPPFNEIAEPPHFLGPEDARGVPSFARAFVHRREDAVQEA
jgi:hypothetical protein